jgi:hypothetical protein
MPPGRDQGKGRGGSEGESLAEVLASIRALVSAETEARQAGTGQGETVLMLTAEMRVAEGGPADAAEGLAEGLEPTDAGARPAPNFDEAALRAMINAIVREELQGELGERINRNLRKLIRREIAEFLEEQRKP